MFETVINFVEALIDWMAVVKAVKEVFTETPIGLSLLAAFAIPVWIKYREQIVEYLN